MQNFLLYLETKELKTYFHFHPVISMARFELFNKHAHTEAHVNY